MVALRLLLILSAFTAASGHTRGAANLEDHNTIGTSHRNLGMSSRDKMKKNLAGTYPNKGTQTGGNVRPQQNGGINGGTVRPQQSNAKQSMGMGGSDNKNRKPNNGGGGDNTGGGIYVAEEHDCVPFNDEMQARASLSLSDDACRTNECGGGCCRVYHWLICDTGDEMPQLSCVCNQNTRPLSTTPPTDPPTPSPTVGATTLAPVVPATPNPTLFPTPAPTPQVTSSVREPGPDVQVPPPTPAAANGGHNPAPQAQNPPTQAQNPPTQAQNPPPHANNPPVGPPPFVGGAPADSCTSGSPHHNNPLFRGFTKCFGGDDCPLASECCIHSFCFCGEPDDWTGDCVAQIQK